MSMLLVPACHTGGPLPVPQGAHTIRLLDVEPRSICQQAMDKPRSRDWKSRNYTCRAIPLRARAVALAIKCVAARRRNVVGVSRCT